MRPNKIDQNQDIRIDAKNACSPCLICVSSYVNNSIQRRSYQPIDQSTMLTTRSSTDISRVSHGTVMEDSPSKNATIMMLSQPRQGKQGVASAK